MHWNNVVSRKPKRDDWIDVATGSDIKLMCFVKKKKI